MIPFAQIKNVFSKIASDLSLTIIRSEQKGNNPSFPYAAYKILRFQTDPQHQDVLTITESGDNAEKKFYYRSSGIISISIMSEDLEEINIAATNIMNWFRTVDGREYCKQQELTPIILDTSISDRTVWLESFFEYRYGFDIRFDYTGEYTDTVEGIETIGITPYPDDVEGEKIIVEES